MHVAIFGPAHIWERIILSLLFVKSVIAPRPISACHKKLDFLAVHVVPGKVQFYGSHIHDAATVATNLHRELTRSCGLSCGGDDGAVNAVPVGHGPDMFMDFALAEKSCICAQFVGQFNAFGLQVCRDDKSTLETHQLCD